MSYSDNFNEFIKQNPKVNIVDRNNKVLSRSEARKAMIEVEKALWQYYFDLLSTGRTVNFGGSVGRAFMSLCTNKYALGSCGIEEGEKITWLVHQPNGIAKNKRTFVVIPSKKLVDAFYDFTKRPDELFSVDAVKNVGKKKKNLKRQNNETEY